MSSDAGVAAVTIPQQTLEDALIAHLTEKVFENPEERDALIRGLVSSVLSHKEYQSDGETFMAKFIRYGIGEKVKEIAAEWVESNRDLIAAQVAEALQQNMVGRIVTDMANAIGDRIKRGY